jgi:hypothetical protein
MSTGEDYILESLKGFKGLKSNAEKALEQLSDEQLHFTPSSESNSIAIIMKHMAGNMLSRFTDFLTSDGEKPNRNRDGEFIDSFNSRHDLLAFWNKGWKCVFDAVGNLSDEDLKKTVYIRNEPHSVIRAINRQLTHYAYHCGQIVFLAKLILDKNWKTLSIPRGESSKYLTQAPKAE